MNEHRPAASTRQPPPARAGDRPTRSDRHPPISPLRSRTLSAGMLAVAVVSAAVLVLAGCATPGATPAPLPLRSAAQSGLSAGAATTAVDATWWHRFGDPALDALVARALADQPGVQAARARLARAQALADAASGRDGPQLGFEADANRQRTSEHGLYPPPLNGATINSGNIQLGASWSLDLFGRERAAIASALGNARAAQADVDVAAQALALQVTRGWLQLARLGSQREVAQRTLAQREELLALTKARVQAGLDTTVELRQSEGGLPDARTQIEALDEQIALARHQLAALSAQPPAALDALAPTLATLRAEPTPATLGIDLLGRRADVAAARERVEAATQQVAGARAEFYPDVSLSAFFALNAIGLQHLSELGSRTYGAGPALHLPIFEGGQLRAQLRARSADLDAAIAGYNQQVLEAVREAADAGASAQSVARQQAAQREALAAARSAHEIALQRYRQGLSNYLVVLATESNWLAQRRLATDLQFRGLDVQAQLMKSLGGGWTAPDANPSRIANAR